MKTSQRTPITECVPPAILFNIHPFAQAVQQTASLYQIALTPALYVSPHGHGEKIRLDLLSNIHVNNRLKHGLSTPLCLS